MVATGFWPAECHTPRAFPLPGYFAVLRVLKGVSAPNAHTARCPSLSSRTVADYPLSFAVVRWIVGLTRVPSGRFARPVFPCGHVDRGYFPTRASSLAPASR